MQCPVCKASNSDGSDCRRCQADLTVLFAVEDRRAKALAEAEQALTRGDVAEAVRQSSWAHWLRAGDDSRRLLALAHVLARDFEGGWRWYSSIAE